MKMLHLALILLTLSGVLTQIRSESVKYSHNLICAVRGFSVSIPCSYSYPTSDPSIQVVQMLWCSMNTNRGRCTAPPYVYNSSSNTKSDFEYIGDDKSNCTLLIHNVQFKYSGEYKFRFITNTTGIRWTGEPGVTLQVSELKVSLIRLSGNGTLKQGDSLNLACDVNCTHSSSQFVWSKNNELLPESGPVLHFPALNVTDSGKYTCTWKTNETSGSETISFRVEGDNLESPEDADGWSVWIIVLVAAGSSVIVLVILGAVIYNRRFLCERRSVHTEQHKKDEFDSHTNVQEKNDEFDIYTNVQQKMDESDIYTNVQEKNDEFDIYTNVQQKMDESDIYTNVQEKNNKFDIYANA